MARLAQSDTGKLHREAAALVARYDRLHEELAQQQNELRDARFSEIDEIVVSGESMGHPIDCAKRVARDRKAHGWIPGPVELGTLCPLSDSEIQTLYATNDTLTVEEEAQLSSPLPDVRRLMDCSNFDQLAAHRTILKTRVARHRPEYWHPPRTKSLTSGKLDALCECVQAAAATLDLAPESHWLREVQYAGWVGGDLAATWHELCDRIERFFKTATHAHRHEVRYGPELPSDIPPDAARRTLGEIVVFLEAEGKLGLRTRVTKRLWHKVVGGCSTNGHQPERLEEFRALLITARHRHSSALFVDRWNRLVGAAGGPPIDENEDRPERFARTHAEQVRENLEFKEKQWASLFGSLEAAGFDWGQVAENSSFRLR